MRDKWRLVFKDGVTEEHHLVVRHGHPDRARRWPRMLFDDDRLLAPMQDHLVRKGNFRRRPSHGAESGDGFPIRTGFISLRFECGRPHAKDRRGFFMGDHGAVHGTRAKRSVGMRIEVDEHAFRP